MKRIALVLLMATIILAGCGSQTVNEAQNENFRFAGVKGSVTIVTDNSTGCKYIREQVHSQINNAHSIALATLLKSDGTPDCD